MAPVEIRIRHDEDAAVAQGFSGAIFHTMRQAQNLFEVVKFFVCTHLGGRGIPYVCQLSSKWKHTKLITTNNRQPCYCKGLGGVSFGQNQGALVRLGGPGPVGVVELRNPRQPNPLDPVILLKLADSLCLDDRVQGVLEPVRHEVLDKLGRKGDSLDVPARHLCLGLAGECGVYCRALDK